MTDPQAAFLRHLAVERNASAHTLRSYANDLTDFQSFLAARGTPDLTAADLRLVRAWLAALHARGLAPASIARRLAAVRSCYRFLVRRGVVEGNPAREARSPRQPRKLVTFLPIAVGKRVGTSSHLRPLKDGVRFLLIIFKIATLYSPLKLFAPVSAFFFVAGMANYLRTLYSEGRFTNMSVLLLSASVIVFLIGLVSEQITALLYRSDD